MRLDMNPKSRSLHIFFNPRCTLTVLNPDAETSELINRALIFVALGEGLAVLGLVVSLLIIILK